MHRRHFTPTASVVVLSTLGLLSTASAATYTVTSTTDSGPASVVSTGPDTFEVSLLRAAVNAANNSIGVSDTIVLPEGVYILTSAAGGALSISDPLTIRGAGAGLSIIDADQIDRVLSFSSAASPSTVSSVTIRNGRVTANNARGGGIYADQADLTLENCELHSNSAIASTNTSSNTASGGGIYSLLADLSIDNCQIENNTARGGDDTLGSYGGGAAYGGGIYHTAGQLTITNSTLVGNTARGGDSTGGNQFNGSAVGGGLYQSDASIYGGTTLTQLTLSGNHSQGGINSSSSVYGGAGFGGGSYFNNSAATVSNTTITGNSVSGGSAFTFDQGGGLRNTSGALVLQSTIVAANIATDGDPDISGASMTSGDHNLIGIAGSEGFLANQANDQVGSTGTPLDPGLQPLADNGGATSTHALIDGSLAFNAGSNPLALEFDQRGDGFPRVIWGQADVGAFENATGNAIHSDGFEVVINGD